MLQRGMTSCLGLSYVQFHIRLILSFKRSIIYCTCSVHVHFRVIPAGLRAEWDSRASSVPADGCRTLYLSHLLLLRLHHSILLHSIPRRASQHSPVVDLSSSRLGDILHLGLLTLPVSVAVMSRLTSGCAGFAHTDNVPSSRNTTRHLM